MNKESLWFGFFEAGEKSSPVAHDPKLNTSNPSTFYLFNLNRNEIIEYKREIAEPKLRDLTSDEVEIKKELKSTFNKAKRTFAPRGSNVSNIPEKELPKAEKKTAEITKLVDDDIDIDIDLDEELIEEED